MYFADGLTLDAPRRTRDGYMAVRAKAAKTGVYEYSGREVDPNNEHGLRDQPTVKVLRDADTVFDKAAMHSFIGKPITDNHPSVSVNSRNWKDYARGTVMGAARDGEYLAFDILLTDADAIAKVDAGKRELSNGYSAELAFGDFTAPDGTKCPVRQARITAGNHVAIVDKGRAGSECRIADIAMCDAIPENILKDLQQETNVKTLIIDGLPVNLGDAVAVEALVSKLNTQIADVKTALTTATATIATKDAEIAALNTKVADAEAKASPAALQALIADRVAVSDKAKMLVPAIVTDGKSADDIRKAVVDAKLGDAAKDFNTDQIVAAFTVLAADAKGTDSVRETVASGVVNIGDAASIRDAARATRYAA